MEKERCMELLDAFVTDVTCNNNTNQALRKLLLIGFTADELIHELCFTEDDVKQAVLEYEDD